MSTCKRCFLPTDCGHESPHTCISALRMRNASLKRENERLTVEIAEYKCFPVQVSEHRSGSFTVADLKKIRDKMRSSKDNVANCKESKAIEDQLPKVNEMWEMMMCRFIGC